MSNRRTGVAALLVVATLSLAGAIVIGFVGVDLLESDSFGSRAATAYRTPEVQTAVTGQVVDQLVEAEPDLLTVRPVLETVVGAVLDSDVAVDLVEAGAADLHRTLFDGGSDTLTIQLADVIVIAKTQLTALDPEVGALIPDELTNAIIAVDTRASLVDGAQFARTVRLMAVVLAVVAGGAFVAAIWLAPEPRRTAVWAGCAMIGVGAIVLVAEALARAFVTTGADDEAGERTARAVWDAFFVGIETWALVVAGIGAVIASVAWFGIEEVDLRSRFAELRWFARRRTTKGHRLLWSTATVLVGVLLIAEWEVALRLAVTVLGAGLIAAGLREALIAIAPDLVGAERLAPAEGAADRRTARLLGSGLFLGLAAVAVLFLVTGRDSGGAVPTGPGCNGSLRLCDRSLDEVTFAATHNSNAAANDGYINGYQTTGIISQLDDGVRGLLIDVYFGFDTREDVIITDRAPITEEERVELVDEVGEAAVLSAEATAATFADLGGERGLYLCHALCEIGATPLVDELKRIRKWLDDNPRDVVQVIIQDEGPRPADVGAAFAESGLEELVYTHEGGDWPTLGEMIDANARVLVSAENRSGELPWYHDAFTLAQDTPFKYESVDAFDCAANRGLPDSPLLLVNHWLAPVSASAADEANRADVVRARVEQCVDERGIVPNLIAVDFHDRGDWMEAVDELNR